MLRAIASRYGDQVHADRVQAFRGPFHCPHCRSEVVLRSGPHSRFAHKKKNQDFCIYSKSKGGESYRHMEVKMRLYDALLSSGDTHTEWPIRYHIADILTRAKGMFVAVEVQCSAISPAKILERMENNSREGIATVWVLGNPGFRALPLLKQRPPKWQKLIEEIQGAVLYFDEDCTFVPGYFEGGCLRLNPYKVKLTDLEYERDEKYGLLTGRFYSDLNFENE